MAEKNIKLIIDNNTVYPQTKAKLVLTEAGTTVEEELKLKEVIANPEEPATLDLDKLKISNQVYQLPAGEFIVSDEEKSGAPIIKSISLNTDPYNLPVPKVNSVAGKEGDVLLNKEDVGLSNVDNTSDLQKPISNATQLALDKKANSSDIIKTSTGLSDSDDLTRYTDTIIISGGGV